MKKISTLFSLLVVVATLISACGGSKSSDLLATIKARGYILVSSDQNYAPQSSLNADGQRPTSTLCPGDALTSAEMQGMDVDVANELGKRLGVETCYVFPSWDAVTAGNWGDKWDISVGSMTITAERQKVLYFTVPYYYAPAFVAVTKDSGITSVDQLAEKSICVGSASTYEEWLNGKLNLPAKDIFTPAPKGVKVVSLGNEQECMQGISVGRTDFIGYVTSITQINQNLADGVPVIKLDKAVFSEELAAAADKSSTLDSTSLIAQLNEFIVAVHGDGTLSEMSTRWFGADLAQDPSK
jgi:polar amino acid transport system substrate-binding protein